MAAMSHWENAKVGCPSSETCKTNNNRKHSLPWVQAWQSPCNEEDEEEVGGGGGQGLVPWALLAAVAPWCPPGEHTGRPRALLCPKADC